MSICLWKKQNTSSLFFSLNLALPFTSILLIFGGEKKTTENPECRTCSQEFFRWLLLPLTFSLMASFEIEFTSGVAWTNVLTTLNSYSMKDGRKNRRNVEGYRMLIQRWRSKKQNQELCLEMSTYRYKIITPIAWIIRCLNEHIYNNNNNDDKMTKEGKMTNNISRHATGSLLLSVERLLIKTERTQFIYI